MRMMSAHIPRRKFIYRGEHSYFTKDFHKSLGERSNFMTSTHISQQAFLYRAEKTTFPTKAHHPYQILFNPLWFSKVLEFFINIIFKFCLFNDLNYIFLQSFILILCDLID